MSSQTLDAAVAKWHAHYAAKSLENTWGHLAPDKGKTYKGYIVFCYASDGTLCPIDYDFIGLNGSPWLYDAIIDFIDSNAKVQGKIYRLDGTFKNYVFDGEVVEISTEAK